MGTLHGDDESFAEAAAEIVRFVQFDLRNHIVRRLPLLLPLRLLARLPFLEGRQFTSNALLEKYYEQRLYGDRCLYELPEQPMLHILATSVSTGALSAFNRDGLFIQQRRKGKRVGFEHVAGQMASIPRVVGASSAFPGFFPPVEITAADLGVRDGQFPTEYFTDGGVYDNLGLRAFAWLNKHEAAFDHVLVSDAGKPFQILNDGSLGFVGQSLRASDILWDRVWQLERENFGNQEGFLFLPITDSTADANQANGLHPVVQAEVQTIRTDLDRFSDAEVNALVIHGFEVARRLCTQRNIVPEALPADLPAWQPIPDRDATPDAAAAVPLQGPSATTRMSRSLRKSGRRQVWSTLLDWRDWTSYLYVALLLVVFVYLPLQVYDLYRKAEMQALVIDSIASGDPEIRQILDIVAIDPSANWSGDEVGEKQQPAELNYEGVELQSHSRIYDLRRWNPDAKSPSRRGHIYLRDRLTLMLLDSYTGDGRITFRFPSRVESIEFRQPNSEQRATISRLSETDVDLRGQERTVYEFEYDLSQVPAMQPVTLEIEAIGAVPKAMRAPFRSHDDTDLISVWLLFPTHRPYRSFSLVSYPNDLSAAPEPMKARYTIDHRYGNLIGWSVVNPNKDLTYECRWKTE